MNSIRPEFVNFIPASLLPGVLYISERYRTASHLCACGCGEKVVTPFSPANWQLIRQGNSISLHPSIGNWKYACRSHYWIRRNKIVWSGNMTSAQIARVQMRDHRDKDLYVRQQNRKKLDTISAPIQTPNPVDKKPLLAATWLRRHIERILRLVGLR